jgi:hypothetical protein
MILSATVHIMPLGDSITYDDTYADQDKPRPASKRSGYRNYLWYMLEDANYPADFVGSEVAGTAINPPFDPENEGHPGWTTYDIAEHAYEYMSNSIPDIILLHIGTNDRTTTNPEGITEILNEIDQYEADSNHHIRVFVALIIDRKEHDGRIEIFNRRLNEMLLQRISNGDDIIIVDMYHDAGLTQKDYTDNTHPNNDGYFKMAKVWYNAIINNPYDPNGTIPEKPPVSLEQYPQSVVPMQYIESINFEGNSVDFIAEIPDSGITF